MIYNVFGGMLNLAQPLLALENLKYFGGQKTFAATLCE